MGFKQETIGILTYFSNKKIGIETPTFGVKTTKLVVCQQKHVVSGDILVYLSNTNGGATYGDKTSKHLIKHGDISSKKGELNCLYSRGYFIPGSGQFPFLRSEHHLQK